MQQVLTILVIALALAISGCARNASKLPSAEREAVPTPAETNPKDVRPEFPPEKAAEFALRRAAPTVAKVRLPDSEKTPGKASYRTLDQICRPGAARDERNVSEAEKKRVYELYGVAKCEGYCKGKQGCEIDHLISLEIGGANTEDNLWPQPYDGDWNAHDKDRLEGRLHLLVCKRQIALREAQEAISTDWVAAYKKYVGPDRKQPKSIVVHCP